MKKIVLTIAAAITFAAARRHAADLRMPVKAPPPVAAAVWSWTGFYVGANGGYSWGRSRSNAAFVTTPGGVGIAGRARRTRLRFERRVGRRPDRLQLADVKLADRR